MNNSSYPPEVGTAEPSSADRLLACADLLACPQCGGPLTAPVAGDPIARALRCPDGHSFDLAKQGYVSLLTGASTKMTGDTPAMLDARTAFQAAGHFAPIAAALAAAVAAGIPGIGRELHPAAPPEPPITTPHPVTDADTPVFGAESPAAATPAALPRADAVANRTSSHHPRETGSAASARAERHRPGSTAPGRSVAASSAARLAATLLSAPAAPASGHAPSAVLEIGAGTGYYLGAVLDAVAGARGVALDVSKAAARRAARAHGRAGSVLADAWRGLPVRDGVMGAVVSVFAPRNAEEVARVLAAQGRFVVVTPTARHLGELIEPLGMVSVDAAKENRLAESLGERFELVGRDAVEYEMALSHEDVANVAAMGPSAFHLAEGRAERIAALPDPMPVTASVTISVYRLR